MVESIHLEGFDEQSGLDETLTGAAEGFLERMLPLAASDRLLIVADSQGFRIAEAIDRVASNTQAEICTAFVPVWRQVNERGFSRLVACARDCSVLISAVSSFHEYADFRKSLLDAARSCGARIVHMPGLHFQDFCKYEALSNYEEMEQLGLIVGNQLRTAESIVIVTKTHDGEEHTLRLELADWPVHIWTGEAEPGFVTNFPTGEVFVSPKSRSASGTLVLNGSAHHCCLRGKEEVVLHVSEGRLEVDRIASDNDLVNQRILRLNNDLKTAASANPCSMFVCELGVGLNRAIDELCGENIIDEKAWGTAHIALGGNVPFGGDVECSYNHDLIFYPSEIRADRQPIAGWEPTRRKEFR
ncbi:aminopeptidase [Candidatus Bipolaricaulota bacterium]|nr:aminopeptidase [Candidatus Bipolaricaulota bacterium]